MFPLLSLTSVSLFHDSSFVHALSRLTSVDSNIGPYQTMAIVLLSKDCSTLFSSQHASFTYRLQIWPPPPSKKILISPSTTQYTINTFDRSSANTKPSQHILKATELRQARRATHLSEYHKTPTMHSVKSLLAAALAAATFITTVNAHMIMKTPEPFPFKEPDKASGPLLPDGSNFPCKQSVVFDAVLAAKNKMPIGSKQSLTFTGSAVHGGGSCQISLTTDKTPSKSSKWMVIHSIIGGCPHKDAPGNLDGTKPPSEYLFTIPDGISAGDYVLAWTWFNKVGSREMYMNCAPVTVTGGAKKRHALDTRRHNIRSSAPGFSKRAEFPEMFVANIGPQCKTAEGVLAIPNPGASVERYGAQTGFSGPQPPVGCSAKSVTPDSGVGSGGAGASPGIGGSPSPTGSAPALSPLPSAAGGVFDQGAGSATPPVASSPVVVSISPISTAAPVPASPPPSTGGANSSSGSPGSSGSSGTAAAGSQPCDSPGVEVCSADGTKIGMCDVNKMAVMGPVASGTKCSGGVMVAARSEHPRRFKFARGHIRRHTRGGLW